jgi:sterol desaturase/sphingolipid hydroxylase (fatty acid hydroxylase superfamily)
MIALPAGLAAALGVAIVAMARGLDPAILMAPLFGAGVVLVIVLERVIPYRPQWNRAKGDVWTDAAYLPTTWLVGGLVQPAVALIAVPVGIAVSARLGMGLWPSAWPLLGQLALAWIVVEFFDYWAHRALHRVSWLWPLHATHHSAPRLYWLNTTRSHPVEMAFRGVLNLLPIGIAGAGPEIVALSGITNMIVGLFQHSNIDIRLGPLNYVFSALPVHRWHHSRRRWEADHNYGNSFIFWDLVFGTWYMPRDREVGELGIEGLDAFPRTYPAQLISPLRWKTIEHESLSAT